MAAEGSLQAQHTSHSNGNIANHSFLPPWKFTRRARRRREIFWNANINQVFISNLFAPLGHKRLIVYLADYVFNTNPSQHLNQT